MQTYRDVVANRRGVPVAGASVLVKLLADGFTDLNSGTLATIYDGLGNQIANPITAVDGSFVFSAANGKYAITVTVNEQVSDPVGPVELYDPADAPVATLIALAASAGASLIGFIQAGVGAVARTIQSKLRDTVSVKDFGAVGDGVTDDTAAIQAAIMATPIKGLLIFPYGVYRVTPSATGALPLCNSITVDLCGSTLLVTQDSPGDHVIKVMKTGATSSSSYGPFNTLAFVRVVNGRIAPSNPVDGDFYNAASDPRTLRFNGAYIAAADSVKFDNVVFDSVKGSAMIFGDDSAVRESVFDKIYAVHCGDGATSAPSISFISPNAAAANGIHNHIYFNFLRVVNSYHRSISVRRGTTTAYTFGTFIIEFNSCQIDNAIETAAGSGIPAGPQCEMVLLENCGWHVTFKDVMLLNPYSAGTGKWGYPCMRIGTTNYSDSTVQSVELINCRFQQGLNGGVGVQVERANKVRFTQASFAFSATSENRGIVVGKFNAGDNYGIATDVDITPYIYTDNTIDWNGGIYYVNPARRSTLFGVLQLDNQVVGFSPDGYLSGTSTYTVPAATNQSINIDLNTIGSGSDSATWVLTASGSIVGYSSPGQVSATAGCVDSNTISGVANKNPVLTNSAVLLLDFQNYNGATTGQNSPGNGNKVRLYVENHHATLAANINFRATRVG